VGERRTLTLRLRGSNSQALAMSDLSSIEQFSAAVRHRARRGRASLEWRIQLGEDMHPQLIREIPHDLEGKRQLRSERSTLSALRTSSRGREVA
jgi:hypothetical protein